MTADERQAICHQAIKTYGARTQIDQCIEEMAELTVELQHLKRGREHHAAEEIADVLICAIQMQMLIGAEDVDEAFERKLARLQRRLDGVEG